MDNNYNDNNLIPEGSQGKIKESRPVKLRRKAFVLNEHGHLKGKVRRGEWRDLNDVPVGTFKKDGDEVWLYDAAGVRKGRLNSDDTISSAEGEYMGTLGWIFARLPRRAKVVNEHGDKIGKVRRCKWSDLNDVDMGTFKKDDDGIYLYDSAQLERRGYVDANNNVFDLADNYLATVRRFPYIIIVIILLILALITAISTAVGVSYINRSTEPCIPTLFVADEYGDEWSQTENLQVFNNSLFGPDKIAPGMQGSYVFRMSNETAKAVQFSLDFSCENEYGIDLAFTLYRDGVALAGEDQKVAADEISLGDLTIEANSDSLFTLEWEWRHNDAVDTIAGENEAVYTLYIEFTGVIAPEQFAF